MESDIFNFIATLARELLGFAKQGVSFLTNESTSQLSWFLLSTLPAVLFFVAFVSLLSYWGMYVGISSYHFAAVLTSNPPKLISGERKLMWLTNFVVCNGLLSSLRYSFSGL